MTGARDRLMAFRRAQTPLPRLTRQHISARGLRFAVFTTPVVSGATPLVCVNGGLLFDHSLLWPALAPLAATRQLVFYDQRGRGASEVPSDPASARLEDDAADLGALRQAFGVREWNVLGHSWGGGIAMLGAEQDLAGTRRLVLVDSVGATSDWMESLRKAADDRLLPRERARLARYDTSSADIGIQSGHARALFPAWFADRALAEFVPLPRSTSVTGAAISGRMHREGYDWTPALRALDRPTIVIQGEQDVLPVESANGLVATLPKATLALVPGAGHLPFLEAPDLFFRLVEEFLSGS